MKHPLPPRPTLLQEYQPKSASKTVALETIVTNTSYEQLLVPAPPLSYAVGS
jgi:hypothetical protein